MAADKNPSIELLDMTEIFQHVYNSSIERIRVDSNASISFSGAIQVDISAASGDNIAIANQDGSLFVGVQTFGGQNGLNVDVINPITGTVAIVQPVHAIIDSGSINVINQVSVSGIVSGSFTPQGLHVAGRVTTMNVTSVATTLPAVALTGRNSLSVVNLSSFVLYINYISSVTADRTIGTNAGWEINPNEGFNLDITDSIFVYAIAASGQTILVKVTELA